MPDYGNPIANLYPQAPPQGSGSLLSDPFGPIDAISRLQQLSLVGRTLAAKQAIGDAYSANLNPDGSPDLPGIAATLKNNPNAAFGMQEAASTLLAQRGQQIANDTSAFDQFARQNGFAQQWLASRANDPNVSQEDILNDAVTLARNTDPRVMPSSVINGVLSTVMKDPGGIHAGLINLQNRVMGAGAAASRIPGPPTAGGAPTTIPLGSAGYAGPALPVGNPPGFAERQAGIAQTDSQLAGNLANAAEGSPGRLALLGNLDNLVDKFTSGPGADWTKVAKAFVNRNVPLPAGWQFSPSSIASQEEFNKQAVQLAQQQFGMIGGTGTDAKFSSAFETSPNDALSELGNKGIIRLLKGNEDALQAKNRAWLSYQQQNPNASYRPFSQSFNNNYDPRVFQFQYIPQSERQAYFDKMSPPEQQKFLHDVAFAQKNGWVDFGVNESAPMPGARKAPDGNWYVPDSSRPGKYQQIVQ